MQSRFKELRTKFAIFLAIYIGLLSFVSNETIRSYLFVLPSFLIMSYGCYSLVSIGKSVSQIEDHPKETESLIEDIKEARKFVSQHLGK